MNESLPRAIAVVGPTATGKTALSVWLAQWLKTEIISADSQVLYKALDIGTAKPSPEEMGGVPHWMIDVAAPDEPFSAAAYQEQASAYLKRIQSGGQVPIVAGGTGFYLKALLQANFIPDVPPNEAFRAQLTAQAQEQPPDFLHWLLREKDPERADALHPNDRVRIVRALEIIEATGQPVPKASVDKPMDVCWIGLTYEDRDLLRHRIDQRIDAMMDAGWLAEVENLVARYGPNAHALGVAHGYPELVEVVLGKRTLTDALAQIRINIHQYARRQMTWFRRNKDIRWLVCDQLDTQALRDQAKNDITEWLA